MRTTIATGEIYGVSPGGERRRLTVAIATPARSRRGDAWQCRVVVADLLRPTPVGGADSFEALARAVATVRRLLVDLQQQGWAFSRDSAGCETLDAGEWLSGPRTLGI